MKKLLSTGAMALAMVSGVAFADSVKLGNLAAVTGPIPDLIAPVVAARVAAAAVVNAQGGLTKGSLDLINYDSKCEAKSAVDAATKAVNVDRVVAIVGASCSGATIAMANSVTIPAGITSLSDTASAPSYTNLADNDLAFRVAPSDTYEGSALARAVLADGTKTVVVTYANDDYNIGTAEVFINAFEAQGGTVAMKQLHEPKKASYRSELSTVSRAKADALVVFAYSGSGGTTIVRNSLELGLFSKFYGASSMADSTMINRIGIANLKGNFKATTAASDETSTGFKKYKALNIDIANDDVSFVTNGFDAVFLMALALEHANGDKAKLSASLRAVASAPGEVIYPGEWAKAKALIAAGKNINYEGASGNLDFDANGDVSGIYNWNTVTDSGLTIVGLVK